MKPDEIADWLITQAQKMGIDAVFYPERAIIERSWVEIPVAVRGDADAYEHVKMLQTSEDTWNDADGHENQHVLLRPTRLINRSREAATRKVQILMKEQYEALNAFASADDDETAAARFHELRQHWESALHELDAIMPREPQVA